MDMVSKFRIDCLMTLTRTISSTKPLQLIKTPIVRLSLHTSPLSLAASVPPIILPEKAIAMMATT